MLGNSTWLIFFKVANAVVKTVLGSCSSHFLCHKASLHKVLSIKAQRGGQRIFMERPNHFRDFNLEFTFIKKNIYLL